MTPRTNLQPRALSSKSTFPRERFDVRSAKYADWGAGRTRANVERDAGSTSGGVEHQEEGLGFRLQERPLCPTSRWFRRSLRLWEMLARAARGTGALLLRVRTRQPSSEARDRNHLGPQLGRSGIPTLGKDWGQRSWSPRESFSGDPWGSRFRDMPSE